MIAARQYRIAGIGKNVVAVYGVVAPIENVAAPLGDEHALGGAALIAGVLIDGSGALSRPTHDLDSTMIWMVYKTAISFERRIGSFQDRHFDADQRRRQLRIEVINRRQPRLCVRIDDRATGVD